MIFSCNVWCSASDENRNLGLPDGDCWMPITIDFSRILAVKEAGANEFLGEGRATIYLPNEHFIIDTMYANAVELWKESEKT